MKLKVTIDKIQKARKELEKFLSPTPLLYNPALSEKFGCDLYLKLETMQPIGSFKIRGALYKLMQLSADQKKSGVIAASAGNHAQGVAWGAKKLGIDAWIVMPKSASLIKVQNTQRYGVKVILEGDNYDEAYEVAQKVSKETGRHYVHAYQDDNIISGQGTVGLEILEQLPQVDVVVTSIGGGGLAAGIGIVMKALKPAVKVIGCQASGASALYQAFQSGKQVHLEKVQTFADGIAVKHTSEEMVEILSSCLSEIVEVDDEEIAWAVLNLIEKAILVAEGAGAVPLAAMEKIQKQLLGKKVVLVISGGNIDVNLLSRIIDRGLIRSGRRLRVNVLISDRPGSLLKLAELIAKEGANVLQAIHDRNEPSTQIDQTDVALTLETRGPEHSEALIKALKDKVIRLEVVH